MITQTPINIYVPLSQGIEYTETVTISLSQSEMRKRVE